MFELTTQVSQLQLMEGTQRLARPSLIVKAKTSTSMSEIICCFSSADSSLGPGNANNSQNLRACFDPTR